MDYSVEQFNDRLREEFGDRLRLRESRMERGYVLEQRTGRGTFTATRRKDPFDHSAYLPVELDDKFIRARDGYDLILTVTRGDRMPCPKCYRTLKVPVMHFGEVRCEACAARQTRSRWIRAYFPLGEKLIEHIKSIAPERGTTQERVREADTSQIKQFAREDEETANILGDHLFEEAIRQLPKVGYTGREKAWIRE